MPGTKANTLGLMTVTPVPVDCDADTLYRTGEVDEDCSSGLPSTCDEECADVLVPFRATVRNEIHHQVDNRFVLFDHGDSSS